MKPIPDGYRAVTPYLIIKGAAKALAFYKDVLGAKERMRITGPNDTIGHAEMEMGDSVIMLADEFPQMHALSPQSIGGSPVGIHVYVEDVDAVFNRAIAAGAKVLHAVEDKFYGDRSGSFSDPFGHIWHIATRKENLSSEEIMRRASTMGS